MSKRTIRNIEFLVTSIGLFAIAWLTFPLGIAREFVVIAIYAVTNLVTYWRGISNA